MLNILQLKRDEKTIYETDELVAQIHNNREKKKTIYKE